MHPSRSRLCFLFGVPRSGTTLLAHLLQQHPDLVSPPEPWLMLALEAMGKVHQSHPADASLVDMASREFFERIDRDSAYRSLADSAYSQYLAASNKRCFIDKTPRYWMLTDFIDRLYPEAPQIILFRNPFAIAASLKSTWAIPLLPRKWQPSKSSYFADLILGLPALAERSAGPNAQSVTRYEDLVRDPRGIVGKIVSEIGYDAAKLPPLSIDAESFIPGASFGDQKILHRKTIDHSSTDLWQSELSLEELQCVTDMLGTKLIRRLGYGDELKYAQSLGVIDKGDETTERYRSLFKIWRHIGTTGEPPQPGSAPFENEKIEGCEQSIGSLAQMLAESEFSRNQRLNIGNLQKLITETQTELDMSREKHLAAERDIRKLLTDAKAEFDFYRQESLTTRMELEKSLSDSQTRLTDTKAEFDSYRQESLTAKMELEKSLSDSENHRAAMLNSRWWKLGKWLRIIR